MTTEAEESLPRKKYQLKFAARQLPWIIAAAALILYFITASHWVSMRSLAVVAKITGWDWHPNITAPLYFLVTYPFRWFSGNAQILGLNFLAAIFGSLTLALLARSVALLPHDRTKDQRQRELGAFSLLKLRYAWVPPVVAALVCGLQLTFWENAVAATGEMFDLLLFAYVIRCLLEFRITERESWLTKFALVYGLAVTNNWAMIAFFPFFLVALIWIKGRSFFNFHFVLRMVAVGSIGLLLYFLLPLVATFSRESEMGFVSALHQNLRFQWTYLYKLPFQEIPALRGRLLIIALTSLLPLFIIGIRWPSFRGEMSAAGTAATNFMFRLTHLVFLGIGFWLFFDPQFSARVLGFEILPFLTFYYLTALSIGYLVGYVLLIFGSKPVQSWSRPSGLAKAIEPVVLGVTCIAFVAVPLALAKKNFPIIHVAANDATHEYSKTSLESLPANGAIILSDDPTRLLLLRAAEAQLGKHSDNLYLDTANLSDMAYHKYLHAHHSALWPLNTNGTSDFALIQRLETLSQSHPIYYLHPSFGYYFERFYPIPHKLVYELKVYPTNIVSPPTLSNAVMEENQNFWTAFEKDTLPGLPSLAQVNPQARLINSYYSRSLNYWGAELQKAKRLTDAGKAFGGALTLNPDNVVAEINGQFNAGFQKGEIHPLVLNSVLEKKIAQFGTLATTVNWNGPFDEPNSCLQLGELLARGGNLRQSILLFQRVLELMPKNFGAEIGLAKSYLELQRPADTLQIIQKLQKDSKFLESNQAAKFELLHLESLAHVSKGESTTAEKLLTTAIDQHPKDANYVGVLTQFYLDTGKFTNALETVEKQLQLAPDNPRTLFTKGVLQMQLGQFTPALVTLDKLLVLQPDNSAALFDRAIANLQSGKLDAAKRDYNSLREALPETTRDSTYQIFYGLAFIAEKQNDKATAKKYFKLYLKHAPANTAEYADVQKRLSDLEGGQ